MFGWTERRASSQKILWSTNLFDEMDRETVRLLTAIRNIQFTQTMLTPKANVV